MPDSGLQGVAAAFPQWARLLLCFFLGSIPFAVVTMWGTGVDITKFGSGNPGFNNVLRFSKWRSVLCLIGDAGKGLLAMWLCWQPGDPLAWRWAYGIAAVLGHCFSPFLRFNGGKGVATAAGVMLYAYPLYLAATVLWYVLMRLIGGYRAWPERGTLASMSAAVLFVAFLAWFEGPAPTLLGAALLALVAWRHKKNFQVLAGAARSQ
ncbi:MAG: glycerol-3-phosphate acyltransferase [Bryobacteraceae bacterium]